MIPRSLPPEAAFSRYALVLVTLAAICLSVTIGCLGMQVLGRTVMVRPMAWTGELARFAAVWAAMLSAAAAFEMQALHRLEMAVSPLPPRAAAVARGIASLLVALLLLYLIRHGIDMTQKMMRQRSSVMGIQMAWVHASVPVTGALMMVTLIRRVWRGEKL